LEQRDASQRWTKKEQLLSRNVKQFRGGLVFEAHRLFASLNARLESNKEEEGPRKRETVVDRRVWVRHRDGIFAADMQLQKHRADGNGQRNVQWFRGGLAFEAHRLWYHPAEGSRTFQDL